MPMPLQHLPLLMVPPLLRAFRVVVDAFDVVVVALAVGAATATVVSVVVVYVAAATPL